MAAQATHHQAVQDFLPVLENWFGQDMALLYRNPPARKDGILMGCPIFGEKYLARFEQYCLPSLMAPQNLAVLKGRARLVLYTDADSFIHLWSITRKLEGLGIEVQLPLIPPEVMAHFPRGLHPDDPRQLNKYWILGVAQNVLVQMAGRAGMAFHALHPDHVYAQAYFPNMDRLLKAGHDNLAQTGISANIQTAAAELEKYRLSTGELVISDRNLGDLGWRHLHKQTRASLMNSADMENSLPHSHFLAWQGRDALHLYSCHMNAVHLSPAKCAAAGTRLPATLDAELPSFMGQEFYVPTPEDGLTFIEVSDDTKEAEEGDVPFTEFARRWWLHVRFSDDWMKYSNTVCKVPIHEQDNFISDEEIEAQHEALVSRLEAAKGDLAIAFIQKLGSA